MIGKTFKISTNRELWKKMKHQRIMKKYVWPYEKGIISFKA